MNSYLIFILAVIIISLVVEVTVALLNLQSLDPKLPSEFKDVFDEEKYATAQKYTRVTTRFGLLQNGITTILTILFITLGGFNWIDITARSMGFGTIITGLIFTGLLALLSGIAGLPFSVYSTFVIEERFGFNKTTPSTFILDIGKSILLGVLLGAPLLAGIFWFFETGGSLAWLYCWIAIITFTFILQFLAPVFIMPLFNKFTPLADGELKDLITDYARHQNFTMKGIFTMDGSKRSTKLNAFFTGFGRFRRIVFFDTLTEKLSPPEIVAVLAHEMGHFKLRHIFKMMTISILQTGVMLYILSLFINNPGLFEAFGMEHLSVYASLIFFGFLYTPISMFLGIIFNGLSRRHEYEADGYVRTTLDTTENLIRGLKKLSVSNLTNLTPHPLHVFLNYSHPPVLTRIRALKALDKQNRKGGEMIRCALCARDFTAEQMGVGNSADRLLCRDCQAEEESCGCGDE